MNNDAIDELDGADGFAPWDGRRVPVTLLGGYLGAGKTTVLNALLARTDRPVAVFVNDVGAVNVDARLVRRRSSDAVELTDGCVCCSMAGGLSEALADLRRRSAAPDHVVVELSGVSDPTRLIGCANSDGFRLDSTVVIVDVEQIQAQLANPTIGHIVQRQIESADLFLLSKTQLVHHYEVATVRGVLDGIAPQTPAVDADAADSASFLELGTRRPGGVAATPPPQLFDPHETSVVPLANPISRTELDRLLDALAPDVVRAKGIAEDPSGRRLLIQVVGRRQTITELPVAEHQPATDLVVITARAAQPVRVELSTARIRP